MVTGVGLVSSLGIGTDETWKGLLEGQSGVGMITRFDTTQYPVRFAGEVKGFNPLNWMEKKEVKKMDPFIQYALAASDFAMRSSGLQITPEIETRVGVHIGSGIGGFSTIEREHEELLKGGPRRISPFFIPSAIVNLAAGQVSIRYKAKGTEHLHLHSLFIGSPFHRRFSAHHRPRRGRCHDLRWVRGGDHPHGSRRICLNESPFHPE